MALVLVISLVWSTLFFALLLHTQFGALAHVVYCSPATRLVRSLS
jgi:hypothetical protein